MLPVMRRIAGDTCVFQQTAHCHWCHGRASCTRALASNPRPSSRPGLGPDCYRGHRSRKINIVVSPAAAAELSREHGAPVRCPDETRTCHIKLIERVHRRATRLVTGMQGFNYNDCRLKQLCLMKLEGRRMTSDLVETFKIVNGKYDINPELLFQL